MIHLTVVLVVKTLTANPGYLRDAGSIPGLGRSPREGHGNLLQHSCLENPMDRGNWYATVQSIAKSQTLLKRLQTLLKHTRSSTVRGLSPAFSSSTKAEIA